MHNWHVYWCDLTGNAVLRDALPIVQDEIKGTKTHAATYCESRPATRSRKTAATLVFIALITHWNVARDFLQRATIGTWFDVRWSLVAQAVPQNELFLSKISES